MKQLFLFILLITILPKAYGYNPAPFAEYSPIRISSMLAAAAFPNRSFPDEKKLYFKVSAGMFSFKEDPTDPTTYDGVPYSKTNADLKGETAFATAAYRLKKLDFANVDLFGGLTYFKGDGTAIGFKSGDNNENDHIGKQDVDGLSLVTAVSFEFFNKHEWFKLGLFGGLAYFKMSQETDTTAAIGAETIFSGLAGTITHNIKVEVDSLAYLIGISPKAEVNKWFGVAGYAMMFKTFSDAKASASGTFKPTISPTPTALDPVSAKAKAPVGYVYGVEVIYRPWDLGFTYVPKFVTKGASSLMLSWSKVL